MSEPEPTALREQVLVLQDFLLQSIADRCGSRDLSEQLIRLDATLFAQGQGGWQGLKLSDLLRKQGSSQAGRRQTRRNYLPGLYPRCC